MNHLYRVIWNNTLNCWQAVVETAKGKTKSSKNTPHSRKKSNHTATLSLTLLSSVCAMSAIALPSGGTVVAGSGTATISTSGTTMTINQTTAKAAINWSSFSLGTTDTVNFTQPSATAITLNRVTGTTASTISGKINANGQIFILNPNGILTNSTAQINVGGLVASTLALSDSNFQAGTYRFADTTNNKTVENKGTITVPTGGIVALIAPTVKHTGTITAPQGSAFLAAAGDVTISLSGSPISYTINQGKAQALINTGGLISASGGTVILTAQGIDALSSAVINATGTLEAQTVGTKKGVIQLLSDMNTGTVNVSGTLDASSPTTGTAGGLIKTYGSTVNVASNTVVTTKKAGQTTLPATGSYWELKANNIDVEVGGNISGATLSAALQNGNVTLTSAGTTDTSGNITLNEDAVWSINTALNLSAAKDINFNGELKGTADSAKLVLNYGTGHDYNISDSGKITLTGSAPILLINGTSYTVINQLGSEQDGNLNTLQGINNNLSGNYALGADIDASDTVNWNGGAGFEPIGPSSATITLSPYSVTTSNTPFTGQFHGLGHTVNNITIDQPMDLSFTGPTFTINAVGLFGATTNTIRDIGVVGGNISGFSTVGGLIGGVESGTVRHSYSTATVKGISNIGGLVGVNGYNDVTTGVLISAGVITDSYAVGDVSATSAAGGLVGTNYGLIKNSHAEGNISTYGTSPSSGFGGLVGVSYGDISNSYATGATNGNSLVGGLVGGNSATISNSYATGAVTGSTSTGGLAGSNTGTVNSSFWNTDTSGQTTSAGGVGKTSAEMSQIATFSGWDIADVSDPTSTSTWVINEGVSAPTLR